MTWLGTTIQTAEALGVFGVRPSTRIGAFVGFLATEESMSDGVEITSHPVQKGFNITDHIFVKPQSVVINAIFEGSRFGFGVDVTDKYKALLEALKSGVLMDVVTTKRLYTNMAMVSLDVSVEPSNASLLSARIELIEVRIVEAEVVEVPPAEKQAQPKKTDSTKKTGAKKATTSTASGSGAGGSSGSSASTAKKASSLFKVTGKII
jgi:hypothetical protein